MKLFSLKSCIYNHCFKMCLNIKGKPKIKFWSMAVAETASSPPLKLWVGSHSMELLGGSSVASDSILGCSHLSIWNHMTEFRAEAMCTIRLPTRYALLHFLSADPGSIFEARCKRREATSACAHPYSCGTESIPTTTGLEMDFTVLYKQNSASVSVTIGSNVS